MRMPAISSLHTDKWPDRRLPALWPWLCSAQNTLPYARISHVVFGVLFFSLSSSFLFLLSLYPLLHLCPASPSSLLRSSCLPPLGLMTAGCQGLSFWSLPRGSADGHSPAATAKGVFMLDWATSEGCEISFCGMDVSGLVRAGQAWVKIETIKCLSLSTLILGK